MEKTFLFKQVKWDKYYQKKNSFAPHKEPHTAKQSFSGVWSILAEIDKKLILRTKKWHLRKKLRISQGEIFLNEFEKGQILKKGFDLMETTFFVQTSKMVQIQKTLAPQN